MLVRWGRDGERLLGLVLLHLSLDHPLTILWVAALPLSPVPCPAFARRLRCDVVPHHTGTGAPVQDKLTKDSEYVTAHHAAPAPPPHTSYPPASPTTSGPSTPPSMAPTTSNPPPPPPPRAMYTMCTASVVTRGLFFLQFSRHAGWGCCDCSDCSQQPTHPVCAFFSVKGLKRAYRRGWRRVFAK